MPRVELLWSEGCPSTGRAREEVRAAMGEAGLDPEGLEELEVSDLDSAEALGFVGSPTVRVDGADVASPGDEPTGLTCRVYRLRDGRSSPTPDPDDLREALHAHR